MQTTETTYALRVKGTDELVRFEQRSNENGDCCGEYRYEWMTGKWATEFPIYELASLREVARAMVESTPWYNSSMTKPIHGSIDPASLEIVKRTVVTTVEPVEYQLPPTLKCVVKMDKPAMLLRRYAGCELPEIARTFRVFELPEGETLESMRRFEGEDMETSWDQVRLFKLFEVPEEYTLDLNGVSGFASATCDTWTAEQAAKVKTK